MGCDPIRSQNPIKTGLGQYLETPHPEQTQPWHNAALVTQWAVCALLSHYQTSVSSAELLSFQEKKKKKIRPMFMLRLVKEILNVMRHHTSLSLTYCLLPKGISKAENEPNYTETETTFQLEEN